MPPPPPRNSGGGGCLVGSLLGALLFTILLLFATGSLLVVYATAARDLPAPSQLTVRSNQSESTRIYDRAGNLLQEPLAPDDPAAGLRRRVSLAEISPFLVDATIATEDANFYEHPGVDPVGLTRAVYWALRTREPVRGTSTISQQLVKMVFLTPERSLSRKLKEAILAAEITRRYPKDTIFEIYLNEINYGHLAYGAEAAARIYFDKAAADLSLAEAALLAGLPQAPATYDPLQNPDAAKARQADVLRLMVQHGKISPQEADAAWLEPLRYNGQALDNVRLKAAPHFVMFVRSEVERLYGPEMLYRGGLEVYTSLDPALQAGAEEAVREGVARLRDRNVSNGALVALRPQTGEILAMVGSTDFEDPEIDGQVNVALAPRQPGSAIKPLTYLAAFEMEQDWWTPATLIEDVRTEFDDGPNRPPYVPANYDGREHGWVSARSALANSYNIPAVKALEHVGVDTLMALAQRFGMDTLTRPDHPPYGLALTLGGGEVTLLELAGAYGALANDGRLAPAASILCIRDANGQVLERLEVPGLPAACRDAPLAPDAFAQQPPSLQAATPRHAYLITDILKDNAARMPAFGPNSALRLPDNRPAAVKTGTTNDVRDGWTVGYTPELVTGVWVGNSSGAPMDSRLSGSQVAGPIWNRFMSRALAGQPAQDFAVPQGIEIVEICADTGAVPDSTCPPDRRRSEVFAAGQLPPGADANRYRVLVMEPRDGQEVQGVVRVVGSVTIPNFDHYLVEYGESYDPGAWGLVIGPVNAEVEAGELALWDLSPLPKDGPHVLRVVAVDRRGVRYESPAVRVNVVRPSPTPTETATPSPSPTSTSTPTATATVTPTVALTATPTTTPTASPAPATATPTATATTTPVVQPSATPTPSPMPTEPPAPTATPTTAPPTVTPVPSPTAPALALIARLDPPAAGAITGGLIAISGVAGGQDFASYRLDYLAPDRDWQPVDPLQPVVATPIDGVLATWDTSRLADGIYEVRLSVFSAAGETAEDRITIVIVNREG